MKNQETNTFGYGIADNLTELVKAQKAWQTSLIQSEKNEILKPFKDIFKK